MSDVRLVGVQKDYGEVHALHDVSLEVAEGQFLALLGPSGCGKTTTLRIVAGLVDPDDGDTLIGGRSVLRVPPYERDIGFVFQNGALFPHRPVLDNVAFGLKMRGVGRREREARAREMLELVRLSGLEKRYPHELSGGQQQRVALARALAIRPKVLLLDEPFAALDLRLRLEMRREVRELQRELGITTIAVTHDQTEALSMSDRVAVMNHGRVEQVGTPEEIYRQPASRFVAEFIGESNILPGIVTRVNGADAWVETDGGLRFPIPRDSVSEGQRVMAVLRPDRFILESSGTDVDRAGTARGHVYLYAFMGEVTRYFVVLHGGTRIFIDRSSAEEGLDLKVGDEVVVRALPDGVHCFSSSAERP